MCRHLEIAESTWHRWVAQFGGMKANDAKRLKELEGENARLKRLLAEAELDKLMLREIAEGCRNGERAWWSASTARPNVSNHRRQAMTRPSCAPGSERFRWNAPGGRAYKQLRREGRQINAKRVQRLWRAEGLKVPYKRRKKRLVGVGTAVGKMCPIRPDALWAMDFQFDTTADGRTLKLLNID